MVIRHEFLHRLGALLFVVFLALPQSAWAKSHPPKEVLNEWFALGSACRAKHDQAGDVRAQKVPTEQENTHKVRFVFDSLSISSEAPSSKSPLRFGKECAIRLNINPPKGKKIKRVVANTTVVAAKGEGSDLLVNGELKLGTASLGYVRSMTKEGESFRDKFLPIQIDSLALELGADPMPELSCGEAKIIGFDYTFIVKRKNEQSQVSASLGGDRALEITAELEDC